MPLKCLFQDNCITPDCMKEIVCKADEYCIAIGKLVNNNTAQRTYANCMTEANCHGRNECVSTVTHNDDDYYCCCKEDFCNKIYKIDTSQHNHTDAISTGTVSTESITSTLSDHLSTLSPTDKNVIVASVAIGLIVLIAAVIILVKYYFNKKKRLNRPIYSHAYVVNADELQQQQLFLQSAQPQQPSQPNGLQFQNKLTTSSEASALLDIQTDVQHVQASQQPQQPAPLLAESEKVNIEQIGLIEKVSHGHLSIVWKGRFKNDNLLLDDTDSGRNKNDCDLGVKIFPNYEKQSWQNEKEIYSYLNDSEFILRYIGANICDNSSNFLKEYWLITEFQQDGSLYDYLKANTITWQQTCNFTLSILEGLAYLHSEIKHFDISKKPPIAHRDLKSKNVLVKANGTCCIADFGLALILKNGKLNSMDMRSQVGTRRYMPPELLEGAIKFTKDDLMRIDVYSCALVLWEIISRGNFYSEPPGMYELPYEREVGVNPSIDQMQELVAHENRRPIIKEIWHEYPNMSHIIQTIEECWDIDVEARISSECAVSRLKKILTIAYM